MTRYYRARRTLHTGADLLTDKQTARIEALFAVEEHVEVEATWGIYQAMIMAYRHPDRAKGRALMEMVHTQCRDTASAASETDFSSKAPRANPGRRHCRDRIVTCDRVQED